MIYFIENGASRLGPRGKKLKAKGLCQRILWHNAILRKLERLGDADWFLTLLKNGPAVRAVLRLPSSIPATGVGSSSSSSNCRSSRRSHPKQLGTRVIPSLHLLLQKSHTTVVSRMLPNRGLWNPGMGSRAGVKKNHCSPRLF